MLNYLRRITKKENRFDLILKEIKSLRSDLEDMADAIGEITNKDESSEIKSLRAQLENKNKFIESLLVRTLCSSNHQEPKNTTIPLPSNLSAKDAFKLSRSGGKLPIP